MFIIESFETTDVLQKERNLIVEKTFLKSNRPLNNGREKSRVTYVMVNFKKKFWQKMWISDCILTSIFNNLTLQYCDF